MICVFTGYLSLLIAYVALKQSVRGLYWYCLIMALFNFAAAVIFSL